MGYSMLQTLKDLFAVLALEDKIDKEGFGVVYVTSSKRILRAESFLLGQNRGYHSVIGPCHPTCGGLQAGDWCGNYAGHFSIGLTKGRSIVDLLSNLSIDVSRGTVSKVMTEYPQHGKTSSTNRGQKEKIGERDRRVLKWILISEK
ncbi:hypothetical protein TNCV_4228851 [Trichonephila clavipes]|nr:hypothetical protein TNCV_4228851 [Trichonephila clavipes]